MRQLFAVPAAESCPHARDAAIALLDQQLVAEGAFVLVDGSVLLLKLTRDGWRARYWTPID